MSLQLYGWNPYWQQILDTTLSNSKTPLGTTTLGRIATAFSSQWTLFTVDGPRRGLWRPSTKALELTPSVGDWAVFKYQENDPSLVLITDILPRKTVLARKRPGRGMFDQVIAANLDVVFILTSLNAEFKSSRLERYLTMVWQSGANPVVVLTKADLCLDPQPIVDEVELAAIGVPYHVTSANTGRGLEDLRSYFQPNQSVGLVGSSGVGKSSLINALLGESVMDTGSIRDQDSKGRHTTTHRELLPMPDGGVVVDSPGMRELQIWDDGVGLSQTFSDIESLAESCYFRDCRHEQEPGCAVQQAVTEETLSLRRVENFHKLRKEIAHLDSQTSMPASQARKRHDKIMAKRIRRMVQKTLKL